MNTKIISVSALACGCLLSFAAGAAEPCVARSKAVNDSNALIMLGGTAKGNLRQVVVGEFGKDVNLQKRLLGQFDRCGNLTVADSSYDKDEGKIVLKIEQHVVRLAGGWQADYAITVQMDDNGKRVELVNKQGRVNYQSGKNGNITSSTDNFTIKGEKGFTETTYSYDQQLRLRKSVARGSDHLSNGEFHYQWDKQGHLLSAVSEKSKENYTYDKQQRELRLHTVASTPVSTVTTVDECQSWDETGNCTLSYGRETEVSDKSTVRRNMSTAARFEYWDAETD